MGDIRRITADSLAHPRVCVMATFEQTPLEELPLIMQFFCVCVASYLAIPAQDTLHLHSQPAWQKLGAWIIAYAFVASRPLEGRWRTPHDPKRDRSGVSFGTKAMAHLDAICTQKRRSFKKRCVANPGLASAWEKEYRLHVRSRASRHSCSSSKYSFSAAPHANVFMSSGQSVLSQTIVEDEVTDFIADSKSSLFEQQERPHHTAPYNKRAGGRPSSIASVASSIDQRSPRGIHRSSFSSLKNRFIPLRQRSSGEA
ncbi:hypothetical protein C8Q77DRAFT_1140728 [Trametes polyzona]|nr:hypothetical protein C8Q77DRAFT_1140728 [Trametes polyzona]